ncbi:MAG: protein phosphatase 2C domain-containing protein [Bacteroidales bacterium]|nr:protein phosphatase 2C domain-containing protein [Bacteroidales bacterium]
MQSIYHFCQGESHKATDKPCQDCAYGEASAHLSMAIVCDGHGGERYFRSQEGARIAVDVIHAAVSQFVAALPQSIYCRDGESLFNGMPFTQHSEAEPYSTDSIHENQAKRIHEALIALFASIISQWNMRITEHALANGLTAWEEEHVEKRYLDEFIAARANDSATFEKTYGCTLMVYVQTPDFWLAFHLGDGKMVRLCVEDGNAVFDQPIPWDEKCFLNKTTSICDSHALEEVRYCYQGDGRFPEAVFLGSDGMDDSYGDGENLTNFYIQLYKLIAKSGREQAEKELAESLPIISQRGSKDDMSVACVYDENRLTENTIALVEYQINEVQEKQWNTAAKVVTLTNAILGLKGSDNLSESQQIDLQYKEKDLTKAQELANKLWSRKLHLCKEVKKLDNTLKINRVWS